MGKIIVLSGSIREGRKSHFVAQLITRILGQDLMSNVALLDLKDYPFPLMEVRMDHADHLPAGLQEFSEVIASANGLVIVCPEYKNGIPGALKNALDYLGPQILKHVPIGIVTVSSGGYGGINCLSQLRLVGLALGGIPIPEKLCVSRVGEMFDENGELTDRSFSEKATHFLKEFLWYAQRLADETRGR